MDTASHGSASKTHARKVEWFHTRSHTSGWAQPSLRVRVTHQASRMARWLFIHRDTSAHALAPSAGAPPRDRSQGDDCTQRCIPNRRAGCTAQNTRSTRSQNSAPSRKQKTVSASWQARPRYLFPYQRRVGSCARRDRAHLCGGCSNASAAHARGACTDGAATYVRSITAQSEPRGARCVQEGRRRCSRPGRAVREGERMRSASTASAGWIRRGGRRGVVPG